MADETRPAIGMSVGATTLAAVTADRAVTRRPVLTLYPNRPSEIGVPEENPGTGESGLVIPDFVDRVGDPEPVTAADGSGYRAEQLLADGLYALAYAATEGQPLPRAVAVAYPAHWAGAAVEALREALSRVPEWSQHPVPLIPDVAAALTALRVSPGLPDSGMIAVCDFGGSGTSFTLVDAAGDGEPVRATLRHNGFSGDAIDQALLDHVVADLSASGSLDATSAAGSLARLRGQCRTAKEELSTNTVTELPGFHGSVWITRAELDEAIREPLEGFFVAMQQALDENEISVTALAAIAIFGGGASIPAITTGLAQRFDTEVVSSARPHLTAAIGAALQVAAGPADTAAAASAAAQPAPPRVSTVEPVWSAPPPVSVAEPVPPPVAGEPVPATAPATPGSVEAMPPSGETRPAGVAWYRRPVPVILVAALAALLMGTVAVIALRHAADGEPETPTVTTKTTTPTTTKVPRRPMAPPPEPSQGPAFPGVPTLPPIPETIPPPAEIPEPQPVP